ncbi:MAG TPA: methyltransferase [Polyangiaceae bacterium]
MKASARFVMIAPIPGVLIILAAGLPGIVTPGAWTPVRIAGLALTLVGLTLITLARWQLGDAFSIEPRATTLVTRGLYARIRNPVYVFGLVLLAGLVLYLDQVWFLLALIPLAIVQVIRARREARVLEERFGDAYRAWRARTWF